MKINLAGIIFTIGLYAAVVVAFVINDRLPKRGANDISSGLVVAAISFLVIVLFFIRSIYQAVKIDKSYWLIVGIHIICIIAGIFFFML